MLDCLAIYGPTTGEVETGNVSTRLCQVSVEFGRKGSNADNWNRCSRRDEAGNPISACYHDHVWMGGDDLACRQRSLLCRQTTYRPTFERDRLSLNVPETS